jgi:hypothetical protein
MARKTEATIKAENEVLARALVQALAANSYGTDILSAPALPPGFLGSFRDCLPGEFKARWKAASMPHQWKTRKAALIPMVEELLRRPEEPTVFQENTDVLHTEEPADVPQDQKPSCAEDRITSERSVSRENSHDQRRHGDTDDSVLPKNTQDIHLDPADHDALLELISWWKQNRGAVATTTQPITERPAFKGNRDATKTIRLTKDMARAAERYIRKHRGETGGNFSAWVELLIFDALGRPAALVELDNDQGTDD